MRKLKNFDSNVMKKSNSSLIILSLNLAGVVARSAAAGPAVAPLHC